MALAQTVKHDSDDDDSAWRLCSWRRRAWHRVMRGRWKAETLQAKCCRVFGARRSNRGSAARIGSSPKQTLGVAA